ncbi:MAG: hypothetical protein HY821_05910 [Acidobacteria bacterium]|nr:hypothetical protein [Acidobacteriota bacterium]
MKQRKCIRILKIVHLGRGVWQFESLQRHGAHCVWDDRPGRYFLEWSVGE